MARLKDNLEYLATRAGFAIANSLPARAADGLASGLGNIGHRLLKSRRRVAADNLRQALGSRLSDAEIDRIVREVFRNIARTLFETARLSKLGLEGIREIVVPNGVDYIKQAHDHGKGALLLTAHFGNWELLGAWVGALGYRIDLLVGVQHNKRVHEFFNRCRRRENVGIIEVSRATLREVFTALADNHYIGYAADQHAPAQNMILPFFGRDAAVASGPARFAVKTGCVIVPMMLRRERYDRHVVIPGELIYPPNSGDDEKDILTIIKTYLKFWEDVISEYPEQWMWTHKRWKI